MNRIVKILLSIFLCIGLAGCSGSDNSTDNTTGAVDYTLNLAYQYGLSYAPAVIAQSKGLIEEAYKEINGGTLTIVWNQMSSGSDINTAIASGQLDGGFLGLAPAFTGISKSLGYKIFSNISGQSHGLMVNNSSITSLGDLIGSSYQIALVNIGSIQHIILAKALYDNGYDAHALDSNIVAMKHPDGMSSLQSGSVTAHLTSSPYIFMERTDSTLHELTEVNEAWSVDKSFIVGIASESLYNDNPDVYNALVKGIQEAIDLINSDLDTAASVTCEFDGNDLETEKEYLSEGVYTAQTSGLMELASFMYENEFLENEISSYSDLVFDNVSGD